MLQIDSENPFDPIAAALIAELTAELADRYGEDGSGGFSPADAVVPRSVFLVACFGAEPVGCGALRPVDASTAEIKRMYVAAHCRGRGIGRALLAALERRAADFDYTRVILETGVRQPEAIALYEKSGYRRIARYGPYVDRVLSVCFGKLLGAPIAS